MNLYGNRYNDLMNSRMIQEINWFSRTMRLFLMYIVNSSILGRCHISDNFFVIFCGMKQKIINPII